MEVGASFEVRKCMIFEGQMSHLALLFQAVDEAPNSHSVTYQYIQLSYSVLTVHAHVLSPEY